MWFPLPLRARPRAAILACTAALLASCLTNPNQNEAYFKLEADPVLLSYHKVTIQLSDTLGNMQATLYDDSLPDLARLDHLPAGPYRGGTAYITILGYQGTRLAYREKRLYDGKDQVLISVDVILIDPAADTIASPASTPTAPFAPKPIKHAPTLPVFPRDTLVSILDSVPLPAEAADEDGDLAGYTWDCDGDGHADDSAALGGAYAKIRFWRSYPDSGTRVCALKVWDKQGNSVVSKVKVRVVTDPPAANAGADTTVVVGTPILLHAIGQDGFGPIVTREWKIGSEGFKFIGQQETSVLAPVTPGDLMCILRVRDSDSLYGLDTVMVKVVYSPDDSLTDLRTNVGKLDPAFRKDVRAYSLALGPTDSVLTIAPQTNEPNARAVVQGGNAAGTVAVAPGANTFVIQVTAQDGSTLQYTVTARRDGAR